jgi:hypothetical protein
MPRLAGANSPAARGRSPAGSSITAEREGFVEIPPVRRKSIITWNRNRGPTVGMCLYPFCQRCRWTSAEKGDELGSDQHRAWCRNLARPL